MSCWPTEELDAACNVEYGTRVTKKRDRGTRYPCYGGGGETFRVDQTNRSDRLVVARFAMSEQCTRFVHGDFFLNDSGLTVSPKNPDLLCPDFLDRCLVALTPEIYALSRGSAQRNLDVKAFRKLSIPLPPLAEQKRIVAVLDEAFAAIDVASSNTSLQIIESQSVFEKQRALFLEGDFEARSVRLDEVAEIKANLVDPRLADHLKLPHIGAGNIESKTGTLSAVKTAEEESLISGKFFHCDASVLYSKIRPYLKKAARPRQAGLCSADVYPLVADRTQLDADYLFHVLLSEPFTSYAVSGSARSGMPKVNREHLFAYRFPLPPLERQVNVARTLDLLRGEIDSLTATFEAKLTALDELRRSLLHRAFTGQLTSAGDDTP